MRARPGHGGRAYCLDVLNYLLTAGDLVEPTIAGVSSVGEMINLIKGSPDE